MVLHKTGIVACRDAIDDTVWAMIEGESNKKRREKEDEENDQNCYDNEVIDPSHQRFLENLKEDGKRYIFECEEDGVPLMIKYEGELSLDDECDVEEPVRKLRSATKVIDRPSDQMFGVEDQRKGETGKKDNKLKGKKEDNTKSSNEIASCDPDYFHFCQHTKVSKKDDIVYEFGGLKIPYGEEEEVRKTNVEKKENEESFPGVEIIDPDTFYTEDTTEAECSDGSSSEDEDEISKMNKGSVSDLKFGRKVPNDLRKPSNKQERDMLLQGRHLNLRNGRGRSYSTIKEGKSYPDQYPVVGQINRSSDQMLGVEDQRKREMRMKQANKLKNKKEDCKKASNNFVHDPDYIVYLEILKANGGCSITSEELRKYNAGKKENAGYFPGVEIIDPDTFYKEGTRGSSSKDEEEISKMGKDSDDSELEFRQQILNDLRKPYNKQEHEKLLHDLKFRRQGGRHLDLRSGRLISYSSSTKEGKSYLDHYPVFGRKLARVQHDELKSLNLLRGFFLYIQQSEPPFRPWDDEECCAITPVSAMNGDKPESSKTLRRIFSWIET